MIAGQAWGTGLALLLWGAGLDARLRARFRAGPAGAYAFGAYAFGAYAFGAYAFGAYAFGAYAFEASAFGACCARCGRLRYNFPVLQRAASGLHMVCFVLELVLIRGKWHDCRVFIHPSR